MAIQEPVVKPPPPTRRGPSEQKSFLFTRDPSVSAEAAEDYAIRKVPYHWKRTQASFVTTVFGSVTSVFAFALGGGLTLAYGFGTLVIAVILGVLIAAPLTAIVVWQNANSSIDVDLLSRGSGFGFLGSTLTVAIYGLNWLMYAGFETGFLGAAVHAQWSAPPLWAIYLVAAVVLVPLNWYGMAQIHFFNKWSVPVFFVGLVWLLIVALGEVKPPLETPPISLETILPALGAILANAAIWILLVGDYARFARKSDRKNIVILSVIVAIGGQFVFLTLIGGLLAMYTGEENPGTYSVGLIGFFGLIWIIATQLRVQEGNYYSSSLAMVNVSARIFHWLPGRRFFLFITAAVAFLLAELKITEHLAQVLTFMGVFLFAWIGAMVYGLVAERATLRDGEFWIEHRRGYLRGWGWPAVAGVVVASAIGAPLAISEWPEPYGGILGIAIGGLLSPLIFAIGVRLTKGDHSKYLIARVPPADWIDTNAKTDAELEAPESIVTCGVCGEAVIKPDACESCPVVPSGIICSACCMAHATCGDACKSPEGTTALEGYANRS
jgi:purine-cytosine permease-like protein